MLKSLAKRFTLRRSNLALALLAVVATASSATSTIERSTPIAFITGAPIVVIPESDSSLIFVDVRDGRTIRRTGLTGRITDLIPCSNGRRIVAVTESAITEIAPDPSIPPRQLRSIAAGEKASISRSCDEIAIFGPQRTTIEIGGRDGVKPASIPAPMGVSQACFGKNGKDLIALSTSGAVSILNATTAAARKLENLPTTDVLGIGCLGDDSIITASVPSHVWKTMSSTAQKLNGVVCDMAGHTCAESIHGTLLATVRDESGSISDQLFIYSRQKKEKFAGQRLPARPIGIAMNEEGTLILVAFKDRAPMLWRFSNGTITKDAAFDLH